jgi:outer membrane protein
MGRFLRTVLLGSTLVALGGASAVLAETLADALIKAYEGSPLLDANEAALRSLDECVPQARAERRLRVSGSVGTSSQTSTGRFERD